MSIIKFCFIYRSRSRSKFIIKNVLRFLRSRLFLAMFYFLAFNSDGSVL